VRVERNARTLAAQQRLQGALAGFDRLAAQVFAVELDQIEGTGRVPLAADQVEYGKPLLVAGDGFAPSNLLSR
jgi:hypothetical protein